MTYTVDTRKKLNLRASGKERILQNVANLLATIKGEIPLGRDIGISISIVDKNISSIAPLYTKEVIELIEKKEPRAKIKKIDFKIDNQNGEVYPVLEVDIIG